MLRLMLFICAGLAATPIRAGDMPEGFVYLRDVDPTIQQDMRYAGADNFTGHPVPGYQAPECVLARQAAEALAAVQADLKGQGLSLKLYDCYRPAQAVAAFVAWAKEPSAPESKTVHYPNLDKTMLFPQGYIATVSGHSRGATMDLTLIPLGAEPAPLSSGQSLGACTAPQVEREADDSLDMGTGFDCFDVKANTEASGLTPEQRANRQILLDAMSRHGFNNYDKEWWHFTLRDEPYPDTIFNFPIGPPSGVRKP
ncbi:MAG: M15 family metallopeptidase [Methyloceanibacter sp.]